MDRRQHYLEAERLLALADDFESETCALLIAEAQVHATLATVPALSASDVGQWYAFDTPPESLR